MESRPMKNVETPAPDRSGQPCCLVAPAAALDQDDAETLTGDLELLSHPVRLRILSVLASNPEPICVCDLEALVPVKQPTVSHHLKILRAAELVTSEKRGLWTYYRVRPGSWRDLRRRITSALERLDPGAGAPSTNGDVNDER
jgi:ArsR family transcriptional regulator, arsenate/arsenite/antimonite-responsive transcriptional repressor